MHPWRRTPAAKGSSELTMTSYWQGKTGFRANMTVKGQRNFGAPACNIKLAVGRLLEKPEIHMKKTEKAAIMVSLANPCVGVLKRPASSSLPALSQQLSLQKWSTREIVTVGTPAQRGIIRHVVRRKDKRVRMSLHRKGLKREFSNWHESKVKAFQCILNKSASPKSKVLRQLAIYRLGVNMRSMCPVWPSYTKSMAYSAMGKTCRRSFCCRLSPGSFIAAGNSPVIFYGLQMRSIR